MEQKIAEISSDIYETIREVLLSPVEAFRSAKEKGILETIGYFLCILGIVFVIFVLLIAINFAAIAIFSTEIPANHAASAALGSIGVTSFLQLFGYVFIGGVLALGITSSLIQLVIAFLDSWKDSPIDWENFRVDVGNFVANMKSFTIGGRGFSETIKAVAYSATPLILLGWIPALPIAGTSIFSFIGIIWSLILCVIGIRELHGVKTLEAAAVVIMALPVFLAIGLYIFMILAKVTWRIYDKMY